MRTIPIDPHAIRWLYKAIGIANTLLLGAFALILAGRFPTEIIPAPILDPATQLNLQNEGVAAVWYNSTLALLVAVVAVLNYWNDQTNRTDGHTRWTIFRYGWLLLAAATLYYSLDDSAQLHDGFGVWVGAYTGAHVDGLTDGSPQYIWVALLGPIIIGCALLFLGFFVYWLAQTRHAQLLAAAGMAG